MIDLGTQGVYNVEAPFTTTNDVYTCTSRSELSNLLNIGIKAYDLIYRDVGISEDDYDLIVRDNPIILTLRDQTGHHIYIPEDHVTSVDSYEHVPYTDKALVINLGSHIASKTFHGISEEIEALIAKLEGIKVTTVVKDVSNNSYLSVDDHKSLLLRRDAAKLGQTSDGALLAGRDAEIERLEHRINALMRFIMEYMGTCVGEECCSNAGGIFIAEDAVKYNMGIADYYLQAMTNDDCDLPLCSAWSGKLVTCTDEERANPPPCIPQDQLLDTCLTLVGG